jgi:hypothetical protein
MTRKRILILGAISVGAIVAVYLGTRDTATPRAGQSPDVAARRAAPPQPRGHTAARAPTPPPPRRGPAVRERAGTIAVPLEQLFDDLETSSAACASSRDPRVHAVLTQTRLSLLQVWANEVRATIAMSAHEQTEFAAIIDAQADAIGTGAVKGAEAPSSRIRRLLGPERFAHYENRRAAFFPQGVRPELVLP